MFGYSRKVELLSRVPGGPWESEVLFTDVDKGHWLATGELDGRNSTDEIVGSGYGGRIFLLSRPPGYGRQGVPVDPRAAERVLPDDKEAAEPQDQPPRSGG